MMRQEGQASTSVIKEAVAFDAQGRHNLHYIFKRITLVFILRIDWGMKGRSGQPEIAVRRFQEQDEVYLAQRRSIEGAGK